jgi:predicted phosphate transport protein (TIGR00153 family)
LARFPSFSLGGREKSIIEGLEHHLSVVKECVMAYQKLVSAYAAVDESSKELFVQVFDLEAKAKGIRRDLSAKISEGAFFGGVREDIISLIQTDDHIAESAKDAARLLVIGSEGDHGYLELLKSEHMPSFQGNLLSAVTALEALIQALQVNRSEVLARVRAVEDCEEAADTEKDQLLRHLFSKPRTMDPVSIIELRDFIFASDEIADNSERASDVVLVLVAKGYG